MASFTTVCGAPLQLTAQKNIPRARLISPYQTAKYSSLATIAKAQIPGIHAMALGPFRSVASSAQSYSVIIRSIKFVPFEASKLRLYGKPDSLSLASKLRPYGQARLTSSPASNIADQLHRIRFRQLLYAFQLALNLARSGLCTLDFIC